MSDEDEGEQFNFDDGSNDGDNEQTVFFQKNDHSIANAGRRSRRIRNQTTSKKKKKTDDSEEEEALSAGEMDDIEEAENESEAEAVVEMTIERVFEKHSDLIKTTYRE